MARTAKAGAKTGYKCSECGWTTTRWVGRCGECQAWGSVGEVGAPKLTEVPVAMPTSQAVPIAQVSATDAARALTGVAELDRVLGGGLVPGAVVLLAGEPGVGKSTLLLEVAARWAGAGRRTLYVSGEESAAQVRLRAGRTQALADELYLAAETDLGTVLGHIEQTRPSLMVVDSIQTIGTAEADGSVGGVSQVREVTGALVRVAKQRGMAVIIIGHVTKEGTIAGPRLLEHLVDVVLAFEGDRHSGFRMVRATKNRFGPADEVGCFEMADSGIVEIPDPSGLFMSSHSEPTAGTCVTVTMEGRRPLLAEVQALVGRTPSGAPTRRVTQGVEGARLAMVLAVLERRAGHKLYDHDVYVSTVGGARLAEPSCDLAIAVAVASALLGQPVTTIGSAASPGEFSASPSPRVVAIGEVGLAGELRRVPGIERRVAEARRLGFAGAVVPAAMSGPHRPSADVLVPVATLPQALAVLGLDRRLRSVS